MVKVEKASAEDIPQFVSMEQAKGTKEFIIPYSIEEHERRMADSKMVYLRILNGMALVGFIILGLDDDGTSVEFRRIVVSIRNNGIGQEAIRQMEHFCSTVLVRTRIWLDVFASNDRGRHVYEKHGYVQFGKTEHNGSAILLYEKVL